MIAVAAGRPGWADLGSPDVEASRLFYGGLFGWTPKISAEPAARGYTIFLKDGKPVAGVGAKMSVDHPTAWTTYMITDSAEETAALVEKAGGTVVAAPLDVFDHGRMAVFLDRAGAAFAVWQPGGMAGAQLFNAPGSLTWAELTTRDPEGAKEFYATVFGWEAKDKPFGSATYTEWQLGGSPVGGMLPMEGDAWPADRSPHWMVYFAVADCDASAATAVQLGGTVSVPPTDIPPGRFAVLTDPHGAAFSIITPRREAGR